MSFEYYYIWSVVNIFIVIGVIFYYNKSYRHEIKPNILNILLALVFIISGVIGTVFFIALLIYIRLITTNP